MSAYEGPHVTTGLIGYWDAGNPRSYPGSGNTWLNLVSSSSNATLNGSPTFANSSITFNGTTQYANLVSSNVITGDNLQTITVSVWMKYSTTSLCRVFSLGRAAGTNSTLFAISVNENNVLNPAQPYQDVGQLGFFTRAFDNSNHYWLLHQDNYHLKNRWINIHAVVNGLNRYLYIDAVLRGSDSYGMQSVTNNTDIAGIATIVGGGGFYFGGSVGQASVYNRALSAAEVKQNFNALRGRFGV